MSKYQVKKTGYSAADSPDTEAGQSQSYIGKTLTITGELTCREPLTINGTVEGNIDCSAGLTIGGTGRFTGEIRADSVRIKGTARGEIFASGTLEIQREGQLQGDIHTPQLIVEEGARFNGNSRMSGEEPAVADGGPQSTKTSPPEEPEKKPGSGGTG